ncbi:hypothetical protein VKT23_014708 [Stygiomarasmius scandens]|uniref:Aromatic prenyltransferase n=1 Tax=Marasmiellus scandens TaxID=2682957 RepID=A0ABR1J2W0_9AGAR
MAAATSIPAIYESWKADRTVTQNVEEIVRLFYGPDKVVVSEFNTPGLKVFDILSHILASRQTENERFFWERVVSPFAKMLDVANYALPVQCAFILFVATRVINIMGPDKLCMPPSILTIDGSPIELSWIIPSSTLKGIGDDKPNRAIRFAFEPRDPQTGKFLNGSKVLDYYSGAGNIGGLVKVETNSMLWRDKIEQLMFPDNAQNDSEEVPPGSRFMLGLDFNFSGTIILKAYYVTFRAAPWDPNQTPVNTQSPVCLGESDLSPFNPLISGLDPSLSGAFDLFIDYTKSIDKELRPGFEIISTDCVSPGSNRLKLYCRTMKGTSWDNAKSGFTLGGRLKGPEMDAALDVLQQLWDAMFPNAVKNHTQPLERSEDVVKAEQNLHPLGGLLYYYEFVPGQNTVFPKIYLPIRQVLI